MLLREHAIKQFVFPPRVTTVSALSGEIIGGGAGGGGARGHRPPQLRGWRAPCTMGPPTLTPVDRNKTYCFHELVLNLPAPLDMQ